MPEKKEVCNADAVRAAIRKVADGIIAEFLSGTVSEFALIGIHQQGVPLARRLISVIKAETGYSPELALLDISMYRDDIGVRQGLPRIYETRIPFDMDGKTVILVDDVLSSGRTIRAALDAVTDYGRPRLIRLAVLVDRDNHEFPIGADYSGTSLRVPPERKVVVEFVESDGQDRVCTIDWQKRLKVKQP